MSARGVATVSPSTLLCTGALLAGLSALSVSCASHPAVSLRDPTHVVGASDYDAMVDRWTREYEYVDITGGFESRLAVTATYLSREFRRAYVAKYCESGSSSADDRARVLRTSLEAGEGEHEFFVALSAQYARWGELDRSSSVWRVRLVDDQGVEHEPVRIERRRQATGLDRAMFYYWTPWRTVFNLHFPVENEDHTPVIRPGARHFVLRFAGPYGTTDLRWELARE